MAGRLVGEVMNAVDVLRARGVSQRGVTAALVVAEGCREPSRTGHVSRERVASVLGSSLRTASRALAELQEHNVISLVARGQRSVDSGSGRGLAARYRLHPLAEPGDTQVSPDDGEPQDTQVSPGPANQVTDRSEPGDTSGQTTGHPGVTLPVVPEVPGGTRARNTEPPPARCPRHLRDPRPPPCGPCGDARQAHEAWMDSARVLRESCASCHGTSLIEDPVTRDPIAKCDHRSDPAQLVADARRIAS